MRQTQMMRFASPRPAAAEHVDEKFPFGGSSVKDTSTKYSIIDNDRLDDR